MRCLIPVLIAFGLYACSAAKPTYTQAEPVSTSESAPQYEDLFYWAAHPGKWDPSDSVPQPLRNEPRDTAADIFFIHPTTFTQKGESGNASLNDVALNKKTDESTILFQASAFNQHARVFAPRYRQAHLSSFFIDSATAVPLFDTAYADVKAAFSFYLQHENRGRPIIIAAHSQGALMAKRLLKEFFDGRPLQQQLVAAYVVGWPVLQNEFTRLPACTAPDQTGCVVSWRTFKEGYVPEYIQQEKGSALVVNPLTWRTTTEPASYELNKGSVLRNFNKVYPHVTDARVSEAGVLWVSKLRFPGAFVINTPNYHIGDIILFYVNIRQNVAARLKAYLQHAAHP